MQVVALKIIEFKPAHVAPSKIQEHQEKCELIEEEFMTRLTVFQELSSLIAEKQNLYLKQIMNTMSERPSEFSVLQTSQISNQETNP